nr:MAG TPA: hypothetical protein [Caudoviricetes sp.]
MLFLFVILTIVYWSYPITGSFTIRISFAKSSLIIRNRMTS